MYENFILSSKTVFNDRNLTFLIITGGLMAAPITSIFIYFQLYLNSELSFPISLIGILLAVFSMSGALGGLFASKLERKYKENLLLYSVPLFIVLSFWIIIFESLVFLPFILLGFFDSILYITLMDYINRIIPSDQRATVLSFSSLAFSVVMIVIFPLIGWLITTNGYHFSFLVLATLVTILYMLLLYFLKVTNIDIKKDH